MDNYTLLALALVALALAGAEATNPHSWFKRWARKIDKPLDNVWRSHCKNCTRIAHCAINRKCERFAEVSRSTPGYTVSPE